MTLTGYHPSILIGIGSGHEGITVDVDGVPESPTAGRVVVEAFGHESGLARVDPGGCNSIEWTREQLVVRTSRQNSTAVYYWEEPGGQRFLVGTDPLAIIARVISEAGRRSDRRAQVGDVRREIRQIGGGLDVVFGRRPGETVFGLSSRTRHTWQPAARLRESPVEAGRRQIRVLRAAVAAVGEPATVVVSGGVDSGLVAALAKQEGVLGGLATLGTRFGNEYNEAGELAEFLGVALERIELSEDELFAALPETIRMLGRPSRETAAGAVGLVSVYRQGRIAPGVVLTGYGADLINSGLRVDSHEVDDIAAAVAGRLADAACAGEFSGIAAAAHGYSQTHMFWTTDVVQAALDTAPESMRYGNREKGHVRAAAEDLLPQGIAWRPKRALHHGSGVERNLDDVIARRIGVDSVDVEHFYAQLEVEMVNALIDSPGGHVDYDKCLDAAVEDYRNSFNPVVLQANRTH
ncbi:asparagine synthase-related protein [Nocardia nova]|uniref:asparagine synthase-related protein n=1 Tax=Nocardia nova TaxID=37330 RepID=UPI0007A3A87F|nr:asparagine synthase-related protein [Nocardia nova]